VTRAFIPAENMEDLKDVAQEVRDKLQISPVSEITEVLKSAGIMKKGGRKKA